MADNELKIKITATDDASPAVKAAVDKLSASMEKLAQTQGSLNQRATQTFDSQQKLNTGSINLASALTVLKTGAELAMHAFEAVENQLHKAIEEALEAEKVQNQLTGALVNTGNYTQKTAKEIENYVEETERMTGTNGEAIKSMIAMGVQMGLTVGEAEKLEEASRKLAAQAGISTEEAFNRLKMTLSGATRGVAQYLPQIKELGEAQLKSGAAIEYVNKALSSSYNIYQQSLPAAIQKAETAVDNVYKAFGQIITQNPLAIKAVNLFADVMGKVADAVQEAGKFIIEHQDKIENIIVSFGKAIAIVAGGGGLIFAITSAGSAVAGLTAAFAVLTGPIGITIAAIGALTAAFYKWPGLFDLITGTVKSFIGNFLEGLAAVTDYTSKFVGLFNTDLKNSLDKVTQSLMQSSQEWNKSGEASIEYGIAANKASEVSVVATKKDTEAREKNLEVISAQNKAAMNQGKSFAGIDIGTEKQRQALDAQVADREKEKKAFETYLNDKMRLAVSKEDEQQAALADVRAKQLKGTGGPEEKIANSDAAVAAEQNKQAQLEALRQQGVLNEDQYQEAILASQQRAQSAQLESDLAYQQQRADLLGESEEGYAAKQALAEERFQNELDQKLERAQMDLDSDEEIQAMRMDAQAVHDQQQLDARDAHLAAVAQRENLSGQTITATREKWFREQEKNQNTAIKNFASGVTMMVSIQTAMNQTFAQLGDALIKNQKITASKMVGVFLEMLGRQVQQKGFADLVMGIFPPNPVQLGVGAAEVALGTAIGRLGAGMQGGQADEGMDEVPQPLSGKSFVLSGGERIVQPSANRDLKAFLNRENQGNQGGSSSSTSNNITLHYNGGGSEEDANKMADIVIEQIRARSERGNVIMNDKGLTRG